MMNQFTVRFRRVWSDVSVGDWEIWNELGEFDSLDAAIKAVEDRMRTSDNASLVDVSMERSGLYQLEGDRYYQYRFPQIKIESPWEIGLNEIMQ